MGESGRPLLGYACHWDRIPQRTWSGTTWSLFTALQRLTPCEDVGLHLPLATTRALQLASRRRRDGRWVSTWDAWRFSEHLIEARIRKNVARSHCDTVLQIQDLAILSQPYFIYQDLSYDVLLALREQGSVWVQRYFTSLSDSTIRRRRERQHRLYADARGVIAMSQWFADTLVDISGLDPAKVHVARPGATSLGAGDPRDLPSRDGRRRLLFLGTSFHVKAGDQVLAALAILRQTMPDVTLTVAGPRSWPEPGPPPPGVEFVGFVPRSGIPQLLDGHDLLVMPSRLEGFGIAFVEALGRGMPCIGRRAFAMPEIIQDGVNGALIDTEDPAELAETIRRTLGDDTIYRTCAEQAATTTARYTWENTAREVLRAIGH